MKKLVGLRAGFRVVRLPGVVMSSCGVKDSTIRQNVDAALKANSDMSGITADVSKGVVTLTGQCKDEMSKTAAESTIAKIEGVKQVVNNCTIAPPPPPPPAPVAITADDPLSKGVADATKDYPTVKASVNEGVITLTGEIKRPELKKLMESLHSLKPKKIDNKLTIK
jgi:osmotically-inducible protein OsmY